MRKALFRILMATLVCLAWPTHPLLARTWEDILTIARRGQQRVDFYGVVLNQFGRPVPDAVIHYRTSAYGLLRPTYRTGRVSSGADGRFEIHGGVAAFLYITGIVRSGHEFSKGITGFDYDRSYTSRHRPDREHPVVFRLREKRAPGTCLLKKSFRIHLTARAGGGFWCQDLAKGWRYFSRESVSPKAFPDLEVTGVPDRERREWRLTIRTNGGQSGIQIRDDLLYEAPADGYARTAQAVFPFVGQGKFPVRYLYLRLREPGMYARFSIDDPSESTDQWLYLCCEGVINPYGDRSFEPLSFNHDNKQSNDLARRADHGAIDAFREQRLAPRPPFEEWVRDGHARY